MAYEEYDEDVLDYELIDTSEEEEDEMPNIMHSLLQLAILELLRLSLFQDFKAVPPTTFQGLTRQYIPDVSVYDVSSVAAFIVLEETAPPPFWAVEVISPGQTLRDMIKKCQGMIESGVEECWIVEPANESITVCTKERRFVRHEGEVLTNRFLREPLRVEDIFRVEL
jgi:Uma2 family endonuclease